MTGTLALGTRLALRELRGQFRGIGVFMACLVLGVSAMATIGSLQAAIFEGLKSQGRILLGGDVELRLTHVGPNAEQWDYLRANSTATSHVVHMRTVIRPAGGQARSLVELKAVDGAYPLYGTMNLRDGGEFRAALAPADGVPGAVVEDTLLDRLGVQVGDRLRIGNEIFVLRGVIAREPDRTTQGLTLGPRVMIAAAALPGTGLVSEGSLSRHHVRIQLGADVPLAPWIAALTERFPDAGWQLLDRRRAAPGIERFVDRLGMFLTLVALTALLVGGVGIANGVHSYLSEKTGTVATLKCLGATGRIIMTTYGIQVLILAFAGIAAGLVIGAVLPYLAAGLLADRLPVPVDFRVYPGMLALAGLFGLLIVTAFSLWPLGRTRRVPPAGLFRQRIAPLHGPPGRDVALATALAVAMLAVLALNFAGDFVFTAWFLAGAAASFALLFGAGQLLGRLGGRLARGRKRLLRMGLANMNRPGAATVSIMLSLGLGLTLLGAIGLIEVNLTRQIGENLPKRAPAYFFIDIQKDQAARFDSIVAGIDGVETLRRVPMLRGHIIRIDGVPVSDAVVAEDARWAVRGDRGFTYAATPPENSRIVAGSWWPADYEGPPLISFDADLARGFGIGVGDTLTVNALGREITAEIANLREIEWEEMGINFTFIFDPATLRPAPHTYLATIEADDDAADRVYRAVTDAFSNVTPIDVRAVLGAVNDILRDVGNAIRLSGGVAILAGIFVLAGALAAGYRTRRYEAAVLKVLGAQRREILATWLAEYAILGLGAALVSGAIGTLAAWIVVTEVMESEWVFRPGIIAGIIGGAVLVTVALGLGTSWRALDRKPLPLLRND